MILGKPAKFMAEIMIEVNDSDPKDTNVLKFENKEFYSMVSKILGANLRKTKKN